MHELHRDTVVRLRPAGGEEVVQAARRATRSAAAGWARRWVVVARACLATEARRGIVTAVTLSWARALGEFGPVLVFSGATRLKTEVLPTTVFLELSIGELHGAVLRVLKGGLF